MMLNQTEGSTSRSAPKTSPYRWADRASSPAGRRARAGAFLIGILDGEGIGPEVIAGALEVLAAVVEATGLRVEIRRGGVIGREAERATGAALSREVTDFCQQIFADGGAILSGPGGGRYVYDLRKHFDLFLKLSPLRQALGLAEVSRLKSDALHETDIVIARENTGGIYQGTWSEETTALRGRLAGHHVEYSEFQVRRFLQSAARLTKSRRGELTVVWKEAGLPSLSALWRDCARDAADALAIRFRVIDIDLMAYRMVQDARSFDVIAAPNLFGDVLADLGAVLLGSRGLSFSGNFSTDGKAVFQTNHGAAYDLARAPIEPIPSARFSRWRCCCARVLASRSSPTRSRKRRASCGERAGEPRMSPPTGAKSWVLER